MFKCKFFLAQLLLLLLCIPFEANADRYSDYIERFAPLAVEHRERFGIPASITLAQGLLESAAGQSSLAKKGNNHFGIKCHAGWTGDTLRRNDDAELECFRAYATPEESYLDHSRFLSRGRYRQLFEIPVEDYSGWARGLKKCGYATDPQYAERLIAIIERYSLQTYDTDGESPSQAPDFIIATLKKTHRVLRFRGLHYVIANPGDTYSSLAAEFNIPLKKLLSFNDIEKDGPIKDWEETYLQEKHAKAPDGMKRIMAGEGETMRTVSQRLGIRLSSLRHLNPEKNENEGGELRLR